jgi:two-component system CheB/CheR fusion protein
LSKLSRIRGVDIFTALAVAILYVICAKVGLSLALRAEQVTAIWPPTGFALVAVLRLGPRGIAGVLAGAFIANATAGEPLWVAAGIGVGNTLEAIIAVTFLRRIGFDTRLARLHDVLALLAAVVLSPLVAATIGVLSLGAGGVQPVSSLPGLWWLWWLGDALGGLLVAPVLLVWNERVRLARSSVFESLILVAALAASSAVVFVRMPPIPAIEYLVFPSLMWASVRFGPRGAATGVIIVNIIAVWGTHLGRGPFAGLGPEQGLVLLQIFMAIAATTGLLLGAIAAQHKNAETVLRMQAEKLSEADRRKDEFLAMLGHELRNPLAAILHGVELVDRSNEDLSTLARDVIRRQTQHMARLVDDLLDVSRVSRGTIHLERRPTLVAALVRDASETWKHLFAERQQRLSVNFPDTPMWIDVDPTRFTQVVANLLHNAAKFTPVGGTVSVSAVDEHGWLVLRVSDSGQGMESELLAHAFDLFVQGPPPLDRRQGGLGLGLTLVRRLVELHGGTVEARSEGISRGSEFNVRIPLVPAPAAVSVSEESRQPLPSGSRRVLIVEDNPDARDMLEHLLKRAGHQVKTAMDGVGALEEAARFAPHVVLLDIGLPGMDGYEVARELRATAHGRDAMIVAVTGYGQDQDRIRSREAGFDHHLLKPVDRRTLLDLLASD